MKVTTAKHNAVETLVFVDGNYAGMVRKFKNTRTETHPHTAMAATAGEGSVHTLVGHFSAPTPAKAKANAIEGIANYYAARN